MQLEKILLSEDEYYLLATVYFSRFLVVGEKFGFLSAFYHRFGSSEECHTYCSAGQTKFK